jgi:hypothetical protein
MWCFYETFFLRTFFFSNGHLFLPSKKLCSLRVLQLLLYKVSPIRTTPYTTSPLSSPFGRTIAPVTYLGVVGVMGVLVPRRWCQNDVQQVFTK